jgi:methylated-DNA-protein-cysteine methyltransferase-like protein
MKTSIDKQSFIQAIYDIVRTIPCGRATSYGAIAKATGYGNMSRMVGKIMSQSNSSENDIPAHRVVNSQGILSGKDAFGSSDEMQKLLEEEGIIVINNKIQNWKTIFWNPLEEIKFED